MLDFFTTAFTNLPHVANNPLALLAYLATLLCYFFSIRYVTRHKTLLNRITSLPASDRLKALQDELHGISLETNMSPEQWIRYRLHKVYVFLFSITLLLAVLMILFSYYRINRPLTVSIAAASEPIYTFLEETTKATQINTGDGFTTRYDSIIAPCGPMESDNADISYNFKNDNDVLTIIAQSSLINARDNFFVHPDIDFDDFKCNWHFPTLDIKMLNRSSDTMFIDRIELNIANVELIKTPVLLRESDGRFFYINNIMRNPLVVEKIEMNIDRTARPIKSRFLPDCQTFFDGPNNADDIRSTINYRCEKSDCNDRVYNILDFINDKDMDDVIDSSGCTKEEKEPDKLFNCNDFLICGKGVVTVRYGSGTVKEYALETVNTLEHYDKGGYQEVTGRYDVVLPIEDVPKVIEQSISQEVGPQETDRFQMTLATDQSANVIIGMRIFDIDGQVVWDGEVHAEFFVPPFIARGMTPTD